MIVLLLLLAPLPLKPAPPPAPPAVRAGVHTMVWRGVPCQTSFHADGFYFCDWGGEGWRGRWSQKGGRLTVTEWVADRPHLPSTWHVELDGPASGRMGGTPWRLLPATGLKEG